MNRSQCSDRRGFVRCWFILAVAGLACALTNMDRVGFADESTADTTQERIYSGLQPGERTKPFTVLHIKDDEAHELEVVKNTVTVQKELRAERQRQQDKRVKASPVFKLAPNEQIGRIMFGMVNARGNRSKNAQRCSQQLLDWAGDSKERRLELQKYCRDVLEGDFQLDQHSRAAIQKLAEDENGDAT